MTTATTPPPAHPRIARDSLLSLEAYALEREAFRARVLAHKRNRSVHLGEHVTLLFEDELTIRYQIQEMLRIEKTFDEAGIRDELDAYAPLVPDGSNLKATMLIEYEDESERRAALASLKGIQDRVWLRVDGMAPVTAIADEDLERENEEKTAAVHFLRFELDRAMVAALKAGRGLALGVDHPQYRAGVPALPEATRAALVADFD
jgi:predicted acylesterase/phospholipase RssA